MDDNCKGIPSHSSDEDIVCISPLIKTRIEIKRKQHNGIERRRKEKINIMIYKISELLPFKPVKKESKTSILERAFDFMKNLKEENDKLLLGEVDNVRVEEINRLKKRVKELEECNSNYYKLLQTAGISPNACPQDLWERRPTKYSNKITPEQVCAYLKGGIFNENKNEDDDGDDDDECDKMSDRRDDKQLSDKEAIKRVKLKLMNKKRRALFKKDNKDKNENREKKSCIPSATASVNQTNSTNNLSMTTTSITANNSQVSGSIMTINDSLAPVINIDSTRLITNNQIQGIQIRQPQVQTTQLQVINGLDNNQNNNLLSGQIVFNSLLNPQPQTQAILLPNGQILPIVNQQQPSLVYTPNQGLVITNTPIQTQPTLITGQTIQCGNGLTTANIASNNFQLTSSLTTNSPTAQPLANQKLTVKTTTIEAVPASPKLVKKSVKKFRSVQSVISKLRKRDGKDKQSNKINASFRGKKDFNRDKLKAKINGNSKEKRNEDKSDEKEEEEENAKEENCDDILAKATKSIFSNNSNSKSKKDQQTNVNEPKDNANEPNANEKDKNKEALEQLNGNRKEVNKGNQIDKVSDKTNPNNDYDKDEAEKAKQKSLPKADKPNLNNKNSNQVNGNDNCSNKSLPIVGSFNQQTQATVTNNTINFQFCNSHADATNSNVNRSSSPTIENETELRTLLLSSLTDENDASTESVHSVSNSSLPAFLSLSPDHLSEYLPKDNLPSTNETSNIRESTTQFRLNSNQAQESQNNNLRVQIQNGDNNTSNNSSSSSIIEQRSFSDNYSVPITPSQYPVYSNGKNITNNSHVDNSQNYLGSSNGNNKDNRNDENNNFTQMTINNENSSFVIAPYDSSAQSSQSRQQQSLHHRNNNVMPVRVHRNSAEQIQTQNGRQETQQNHQRQTSQQTRTVSTSSSSASTINKSQITLNSDSYSNNSSLNNSFSVYSAEALIRQPTQNQLDNTDPNRYNSSQTNQQSNIDFMNSNSIRSTPSRSAISYSAESLIQSNNMNSNSQINNSKSTRRENDNNYYDNFNQGNQLQTRNTDTNCINPFSFDNRNANTNTVNFPLPFQTHLPEVTPALSSATSSSVFSMNTSNGSSNRNNSNSSNNNVQSSTQHSPVASSSSYSSQTSQYSSQSSNKRTPSSSVNPFNHTNIETNYGSGHSLVYPNMEPAMTSNQYQKSNRHNDISLSNCIQPTGQPGNLVANQQNSASNAGCFFTNSTFLPNSAAPFPPLIPAAASPFDSTSFANSHRPAPAPMFPNTFITDFNTSFVNNNTNFLATGTTTNSSKQRDHHQQSSRSSTTNTRSPNSKQSKSSGSGNNKSSSKKSSNTNNKQTNSNDNANSTSNSSMRQSHETYFSMSEIIPSTSTAQSTNRYTNFFHPSQSNSRQTDPSQNLNSSSQSINNNAKSPSTNSDSTNIFRSQTSQQNSSLNINFQSVPSNFSVNSLNKNSSTNFIPPTNHVPNFNLSNIFPDINTSNTESLSLSPMKFPAANAILPPTNNAVSSAPSISHANQPTISTGTNQQNQSNQNQSLYHSHNHRISSAHNPLQFNSFLSNPPNPSNNGTNFEPQINNSSRSSNNSMANNPMSHPPPPPFPPTHHPHTYANIVPSFNFTMHDH